MEGRSIPEDTIDFYSPVLNEINLYTINPPELTHVEINFEYINSSSVKILFTLLHVLGQITEQNKGLKITWHYEEGDEDMMELGEILESILDCPFTFIETEDPSLS